jgi:hypothetical protein
VVKLDKVGILTPLRVPISSPSARSQPAGGWLRGG